MAGQTLLHQTAKREKEKSAEGTVVDEEEEEDYEANRIAFQIVDLTTLRLLVT